MSKHSYTKITVIACIVSYILAGMLMSSANSFAKFFLNF